MESKKSKVFFRNEPKLSPHEAQNGFNKRRVALIPQVKKFISSHQRFKDKEVNVIFAHKGVSSLVCIVETIEEKLVLKIPLSTTHSFCEDQFLNVWRNIGVRVPHIIEKGGLGEHSYLLMDYIDASTIGEKFNNEELIKNSTYFEMGIILSKMHEPKGEGYGQIIDNKPEFSLFKDWLASTDMKERFRAAEEGKLLSKEHGLLLDACEILLEYIGNSKESSYCHFDFCPDNIFATEPITVFDPNSQFNNRYIDLGRSIVIHIANNSTFPKQMVNGYFGGKPYNKKVLQAAILVNSYMKFYYWHQVKKLKEIKNVQEYLTNTTYLFWEK